MLVTQKQIERARKNGTDIIAVLSMMSPEEKAKLAQTISDMVSNPCQKIKENTMSE